MPNNLDLRYIVDEKTGQRVLPITHMSAVRDSDGNTLPTLMAPEKNGFGIGTCSTSSGTALTAAITGYKLVTNAFVMITFENDVPAGATLNINGQGAKAIFYKGAVITADTIKAGDTVILGYNGTNYVVGSLGGGNMELVEYININLTCDDPSEASNLVGATVVVTDDDNQETIFSTTWQGTTIECTVDVAINYTIRVGKASGFITPSPKTFKARVGYTRTESFVYEVAYVNLGLPSGLKWAKGNIVPDGNGGYNIGKETDYGAFFSWGNIVPHFSTNGSTFDDGYSFDATTYASTPGASITGSQTKDASFAPNSGYDAARELLGGSWRIPTQNEFEEMDNNCNHVKTTKNGVTGMEFTSRINGNKIFLPYSGTSTSTQVTVRNEETWYLTSSVYNSDSCYTPDLYTIVLMGAMDRKRAYALRAVK